MASASVTLQLRRSSTPLRTATSVIASAYSHGFTMAALGAHSAPQTFSERLGSMARVSSRERIFMPGTPLAVPFSNRCCRWGSSFSSSASTSEPHCL